MPTGIAAVVALGFTIALSTWRPSQALSPHDDELSLLQVASNTFAVDSENNHTSADDYEAAKALVESYEKEKQSADEKEERELADKLEEERKVAETQEAQKRRALGLKQRADTLARRPKKHCPHTFTTTSVTTTSTYKPLPHDVFVAFTTGNVTGPTEGYDVCFDPMIDEQRGFTLDLFISSFPDPNSEPQYNGTVIASKFFNDPGRGDLGNVGWALLYYKQGVSYTSVYDRPFLEFKISSGGSLFTTRQYLPKDQQTARVTVSYNGPHYKRVRMYIDKEEQVFPPHAFPASWLSTLSPQDMVEEFIPATTACMSIQKLSPQKPVHGGNSGFHAATLSFATPYQGTVGGITFYQGQVTMAHMRDYYMP